MELVRSTEGIDIHADRLKFPDTTVLFLHGPVRSIADFAAQVPGAITEIRAATGTIEPFLDQRAGGATSNDWVADLVERMESPPENSPSVCALDTGVAGGHPLLALSLAGAWAYDDSWGADDHYPYGGHGTAIAGLILFGDLDAAMQSAEVFRLTHTVESMKLLPPAGFPPTRPLSYGIATQGAVAKVEVERAGVKRAFCLAASTEDFPPSRPSTWSGALDQIAAGSMAGDSVESELAMDRPKRLMLVATGNTPEGMLEDVKLLQSMEDPSQSWNALTIGGFTRKDVVPAPPPLLTAVVAANNRSPYSRGSTDLPFDITPIKPEVLFEAGNMLHDAGGLCDWHPSVSLLALGKDVTSEPLVPFWATSAAVGVAGHFIGQLQAALPMLWPETHRALTVDSAQWPGPVHKRFVGRGAHWKSGSKRDKQMLLREVGYGVPQIDRAIQSARNDMSLIAQSEIQPFALGSDGRSGVFNEMHFYDLPWPRSTLEALENEVVVMKVTLSYFVEPNLSGRAATRPDTYRSFGLRFAMKKRSETDSAFRARINAAQERDTSNPTEEAGYWLLGEKAINAGSLHCDLWRGYAIDLAGHDAIAVFPVGGWWKSHTGQRRVTDKGRYALVVSISAPGHAVDMHAEVEALVSLGVGQTVSS
ncbi:MULTISPECIES: S8 family peptidase [unclassified Pseudoxanthomonas]|uniref:S8 family peptidase n=1 Tax=unclassified Pseudoxanthomonas TaxID=2645906 RepID=UPI00307F2F58